MIRVAFGLLSMPLSVVFAYWMGMTILTGFISPSFTLAFLVGRLGTFVFLGLFVFYYILFSVIMAPAFLLLIKFRRLAVWNYIVYGLIGLPIAAAVYIFLFHTAQDQTKPLSDIFIFYGIYAALGAVAGVYFWCVALWRNQRYFPQSPVKA